MNASEPLMTCRELSKQCRNREGRLARDKAQRRPELWLGGNRHKGGVSPEQAWIRNVRTCRSDEKGRAQVEGLHKRASTDAEHRGGAVRSWLGSASIPFRFCQVCVGRPFSDSSLAIYADPSPIRGGGLWPRSTRFLAPSSHEARNT